MVSRRRRRGCAEPARGFAVGVGSACRAARPYKVTCAQERVIRQRNPSLHHEARGQQKVQETGPPPLPARPRTQPSFPQLVRGRQAASVAPYAVCAKGRRVLKNPARFALSKHVARRGRGNFNLHPDAPAVPPKAVVAAAARLDLKKIAFGALPWDLELHCNLPPCAGRRPKPSSCRTRPTPRRSPRRRRGSQRRNRTTIPASPPSR